MPRDEKKPIIRCAGYTDPWEQHEFSSFFDYRIIETGSLGICLK